MDMSMADYRQLCEDYSRIEQAILFLDRHAQEQPGLNEIAAYLGLSEYHFQRLFSRWVGISPKRFLQYLTKEHAKYMLEQSGDVLSATYESGLSSPSRLHDLLVTCEAVTPGEYKSGGTGLTITYGFHPVPFGDCLLAVTERGICGLQFVQDGDRVASLDTLKERWPNAFFYEDPSLTFPLVRRIFPIFEEHQTTPLHLFLRGTNFQIKVWEALMNIPAGNVVSYEELAAYVGRPKAVRAVGQAVAHNPVAVVIPCHRVIRKVGDFGGYRWGLPRKRALLGWEVAHAYTLEMDN